MNKAAYTVGFDEKVEINYQPKAIAGMPAEINK